MGEAALRERNDLVSEMGNSVPGSDWDPVACLRTAGVPLAPLDDVMEVVGRALIELCDANMPLAAAPLVEQPRGEHPAQRYPPRRSRQPPPRGVEDP